MTNETPSGGWDQPPAAPPPGAPGTPPRKTGRKVGVGCLAVVDRMLGGLDHVGNLRPLCESCHRLQPSFGPEEVDQAVAWFSAGYDPIRDIAREVNAAHEEGWRRAAEELGMSLAEYEDHCIQRVHTTREHDAD